MTDDEATARAAIAATLGACTQAGDARKADAYAASFTEDGVLELDQRIEGREAIRQWMAAPSVIPQPAGPSPGYVSHHLTTCQIEVLGPQTASARTYFHVMTQIGPDHAGYYVDRLRKVGDRWLIADRRIRVDWRAENSLFRT